MINLLAILAVIAIAALWFGMGGSLVVWGVKHFRNPEPYDEWFEWVGAILFGLVMILSPFLVIALPKDDRPCVRYEESVQYNPATKTVMPYRYCAQYGEWVK